jgi:CDP-glucose 4,6-dehydratase
MINNNFWKNKKVFVTGHTGFKGGWLSIFLTNLGAKVTGYSLKPKSKPNLFELANVKSLIQKSIIADIRNFDMLDKEIKISQCSILFHLAAQPLVRTSYIKPKETFDININGTLNILEAIRKNKKLKSSIIITTDKVYDISKNKIFKETDKLGGIDPYSASKVCCEYLSFSYIKSFFKNNINQRIATVRAGNVIGGGDYSDDRLIPDIYLSAKKKKNIILRNPNSIRPWQHVLEPLSGYLLLAENLYKNKLISQEQNWNFAPNISSCKSVKYIANKFAKSLNLKIKTLYSGKPFRLETDFLRLSNSKAKKYINWHPRWKLDKSLNKIIEWNNEIKKSSPLKVCQKQIKEFLNR